MNRYWLLKTEPGTYSFQKLLNDRRTNWNGVRNFQARNNLKSIGRGDTALIYHSGDDKAVVGVAEVVREAYPDPDPEMSGDWVQIDIAPVESLSRAVSLKEIKAMPSLKTMPLVTHSRLSVMPVSAAEFKTILKMATAKSKGAKDK